MRRGTRQTDDTAGLYPRLMGERWLEVAGPVRRAHSLAVGQRARGSFRIRRGEGLIPRTIARVFGLPVPAAAARAELQVVPEGEGERWQRDFAGSVLNTRQRQVGDGLLGERIGAMELRFQLTARRGGLVYRQVEAGICVGRWYVPLPARWVPVIAAEETPEGDGVRVEVSVTHPCAGLLLSYDGCIQVAEARG